MAYFIELQSNDGHPLILNVEHIVYIKPLEEGCMICLSGVRITSSDSNNTIRSVSGNLESIYVAESYETLKRKINE